MRGTDNQIYYKADIQDDKILLQYSDVERPYNTSKCNSEYKEWERLASATAGTMGQWES